MGHISTFTEFFAIYENEKPSELTDLFADLKKCDTKYQALKTLAKFYHSKSFSGEDFAMDRQANHILNQLINANLLQVKDDFEISFTATGLAALTRGKL